MQARFQGFKFYLHNNLWYRKPSWIRELINLQICRAIFYIWWNVHSSQSSISFRVGYCLHIFWLSYNRKEEDLVMYTFTCTKECTYICIHTYSHNIHIHYIYNLKTNKVLKLQYMTRVDITLTFYCQWFLSYTWHGKRKCLYCILKVLVLNCFKWDGTEFQSFDNINLEVNFP